jgi:hypothetical protein
MEIVTPDFSITQEKDQTLDLHIAKEENGEMLVKNDGDKITVKTKKSEKETEVKQVNSELVAINPDSEKINVIEDGEVMLNFMAKNNISATFTLSTQEVQWPEIKREEPTNVVAIQTNPEPKESTQNVKTQPKENVVKEEIKAQPAKDPLIE